MPLALPPSPPALVQQAREKRPAPQRTVQVAAPAAGPKGPVLFQFPPQLKAGENLPVHLNPAGLKARLAERMNHKLFDGRAQIVRADATGLDIRMTYTWNLTASLRIEAVGNQIHCVIDHPNEDLKIHANDRDEFELTQPRVTPTGTTFSADKHSLTDARKKAKTIKKQELPLTWNASQLVVRYDGHTMTLSLGGGASRPDQYAHHP